MKKSALYSSTSRSRGTAAANLRARRDAAMLGGKPAARDTATGASVSPAPAAVGGLRSRLLNQLRQQHRSLIFSAGLFVAAAIALAIVASRPEPAELTQEEIDTAVLDTLENKSLPSRAAKAAESVREVVVRVRGFLQDDFGSMHEYGTGSGVVILDKGLILTNLHVVSGATHLTVTFYDGMEARAEVVSMHPENDLAVILAKQIPDDLPAATLGSASRLHPGDEVVAVGFPFGIGPSVSAGVVSGLGREFRAPDGKHVLTQLIQFDAAANPGNSGGPLLTMDGEVVGIVTAILNPTRANTFVGIGFAVTIAVAGNAVGIPPF